MGFLDNLKDRILGNSDDDYYDDDYDDFEDEEEESGSGILGNTRRPEADSVSVYTRSGRPLNESPKPTYEPERRSYDRHDDYDRDEVAPRVSSGQLPPYVLRPVAYDDVQMVVRRVRTNQPVVLVFKQTDLEVAKRILDFCFGLSFGINGSVEELGDRVFAVLPAGLSISQADLDRLAADGTLTR
jgi:cell division inhibitor SepF